MTESNFIKFLCWFLVACFVTTASATSNKDETINYDIQVRIDPVARILEGRSVITVKKPGELTLVLGKRFEVTKALIDGQKLGAGRKNADERHIWQLPFTFRRSNRIEIHWHGQLSSVDTSLDHQQTLGRAEAASSETGTFLSSSSNWHPHIVDALASYQVELELPPGQRGLVAGRLLEETVSHQGYRASFEFPFPAEGIDLMAGPYDIETELFQGANGKPIQLRTYFHPQISHLASDYLEAVKEYFELYESWIGAYPFTEFSIVSSPTPTGFGMPTLTYLGIRVLQLPFIRATSLGHEVLHNWWGNGVYPDYMKGNWSEGLTTFMADYTYKERESNEAAREMRLGWLRDFAALSPGQDAPLSTFTSRTHGASKIVGYNKVAMFFFMLRDKLGEEIFNRAIQALWNTRRFEVTSWQHIQSIFEIVSGQDLQVFFSQWLDRTGAPDIAIVEAKQSKLESGYQVMLTLTQSQPAYHLQVPIVIRSAEGEESRILDLNCDHQTFSFELPSKPLEIALDPDLRLFRQLAPGEAPPILREVMVNPDTATILLPQIEETYEIAVTLATKLQHRPPKILPPTGELPAAPTLVIGLENQVIAWLKAHHLPAQPGAVSGEGSAQAWTIRRSNGSTVAIVSAQDASSLAALIRPLPHYGRQSYIAFDGARATKQGAWPMKVQTVMVE